MGCFVLLQGAYERHLSNWLLKNPFSVIRKVDFLELLFNTRTEVYSVDTVKSAWKASGCWPIDLERARKSLTESVKFKSSESAEIDHALSTPIRVRKLARETQQFILDNTIDNGAKITQFQSLVDLVTTKLTAYRDIAPRVETLNKLQNGKTQKNRGPSRQVGIGRVLSRKLLNEGLKKLAIAEAAKAEREKAALEHKLAAEERKNTKQELDKQYQLDLDAYADQITAWKNKVAELDAAWKKQRDEARMAHRHPPKKPTPPNRPKRPIKPKGVSNDLTIIPKVLVDSTELGDSIGTEVDTEGAYHEEENNESEELSEFMRDLDLDRFEHML